MTQGDGARHPLLAALGRAVGSLAVRVVVTLALLAVVAAQVNWAELGRALRDGRWEYFALAVGAMFLALVCGGVRWHLLLRAAHVSTTPRRTAHAYAIGIFTNLFLPTAMGGDAARGWLIGRSGAALVAALVTVVVERLSALACLFVLAWIAVAADPAAIPSELIVALAVASAVGIVALALAALAIGPGRVRLGGLVPGRARGVVREVREALVASLAPDLRTVKVFALGFVFQALVIVEVWATGEAINMDLPLALAAVASTLVLVVTLVPLSVAGLGLREGGYVVVLGAAGYGATEATLLSLLTFVALALASAPGALGLIWPMEGAPAASSQPEGGQG